MDMLGDREKRKIVSKYYDDSGEPELVRKAVSEATIKEKGQNLTQKSNKLQQWRYDYRQHNIDHTL